MLLEVKSKKIESMASIIISLKSHMGLPSNCHVLFEWPLLCCHVFISTFLTKHSRADIFVSLATHTTFCWDVTKLGPNPGNLILARNYVSLNVQFTTIDSLSMMQITFNGCSKYGAIFPSIVKLLGAYLGA